MKIVDNDVNDLLERIYAEAVNIDSVENICELSSTQLQWVTVIYKNEENFKGVYTVLVTSLTYKIINPSQDVRKHQANMENGYSGRSFDTKFITPFLKKKNFAGKMKESGWLTRSLEQNIPYNMDFPGKINSKVVKTAFLSILNDIEENGADPEIYLKAIFCGSILEKSARNITLINPIKSESSINISTIMEYLHKQFYYDYNSRGASILPVIAIYSIYQCIVPELKRFENKTLMQLASHNSSDRSSGATGDIVVLDTNGLYEVVEVKFDIPITATIVKDAYEKIKSTNIQRYYILSTKETSTDEILEINKLVNIIRKEHGCQIIVNGVFQTLKYYLRLLSNTDIFIENYIHNIENNSELNVEHKQSWNDLFKGDL